MSKNPFFSMLNQSWKNMEIIIIIDNPENIEARDFLYGIAGKYDKVHVYQNEENKGLPYCLNKGISLAKGKYLARMDADDISLPSRIEEEMAYLNNGNYDIVFSNRIDIDENNNVIREKRIIPQEQK